MGICRIYALIIATSLVPTLQGLARICEKIKDPDALFVTQPGLEKRPGQHGRCHLMPTLLHETLP
jgi:hypothetical protein